MRSFLVLAPLLVAPALAAQTRADSAWAAGDRALARRLYAQELSANPDASHATFRLAQLNEDPAAALKLYTRYTELEPDDPWGWMALGDALAAAGRAGPALRMYERAARLAPHDPEITNGETRMRRARADRAPALEPEVGYAGDSDGNHTSRAGLKADWAVGRVARLGISGSLARIGDGSLAHGLQEGSLRFELRRRTAFVALSAGAARLARGAGLEAWLTPTGEARLRWRSANGGTSLELRGQRLPLGTTPLLLEQRAMRDEGRAIAQLPLGPLRLRAGGRAARIKGLDEINTRLGADGALVLPLGWRGELSLQYHRLGYRQATVLGYFAPQRVETIEGGSYAELEAGPVSLALDLGAGIQRLREFGSSPAGPRSNGPMGPWAVSLRGYSFLAIPFAAGRQIRVELEAYDAPFAPDRSTRSAHWRSFSVSTGVRWALRS